MVVEEAAEEADAEEVEAKAAGNRAGSSSIDNNWRSSSVDKRSRAALLAFSPLVISSKRRDASRSYLTCLMSLLRRSTRTST